MDVAFVIDESGSIKSKDFTKMKTFVQSIVKELDVSQTKTQVALMTFSDPATIRFTFKNGRSKSKVLSLINGVRQRRGGTNTDIALRVLVNLMSSRNGGRSGVQKIAILMTDGKSRSYTHTKKYAALARAKGITLIAVGIGNYRRSELNAIAKDPDSKHVFTTTSFAGLAHLKMKITRATCTGML